jgi:hypothetical protein
VPAQDVCGYDEHSRKFAASIAAGVGIIILGVALNCFLALFGPSEELSVIATLVGVLAGLAFIIPAGIEHAAFAKAHPFVEDFYTDAQKAETRQWFTRLLVAGIGLIFAGIIVVIVSEVVANDDIGSAIMLLLIAGGVYLIVRGSIYHGLVNVESYNQERANEQWERENPRVGRVCGIIMLVATIVGLVLLFAGPYLPGSFASAYFWLAWPIGGILCAIATLAMRGNDIK